MEHSLTKGSPIKGIIFFSIPLFLGNIFQQIYTLSDTLIVGRAVGVNALAAVGATAGLSGLIIGFAQGMTVGLSILTAQEFGTGDLRSVKKSFANSIWICIAVSVILTIIGVGLARPLLVLMQTPKVLLDGAETFIGIMFMGLAVTVFYNLFANMLRALGNSRTPLIFLIIAAITNVILDIVLVIGLNMGIAGAGIATVTAELFSCLLCVWYIRRHIPELSLRISDMKIDRDMIKQELKLGLPMGFQASIISIGSIILQVSLNQLGAQSIAAYTAAGKIDSLATQPMVSLGITMATFTAQNFGAKNYERILVGIKQCLIATVTFSFIIAVVIILNSNALVNLFIGNSAPEVTRLAHTYFLVVSTSYFLLSILFVVRYALQGLGRGFAPTMAGVAELVSRIFVGIVLVPQFGFIAACFASPLAWLASVAVLIVSFMRTMRNLRRVDGLHENVTLDNENE